MNHGMMKGFSLEFSSSVLELVSKTKYGEQSICKRDVLSLAVRVPLLGYFGQDL